MSGRQDPNKQSTTERLIKGKTQSRFLVTGDPYPARSPGSSSFTVVAVLV